MGLLIGVDGGGTNTRGIASDESGNILAETTKSSCSLNTLDPVDAATRLEDVISELLDEIGSGEIKVEMIVPALAGAERKEKRNTLLGLMEEKLPVDLSGTIEIISDAQAALTGAVGGGEGLMVNSGTGAIALGRDDKGNIHRADGWGYLLGDEGSGYWIGLAAIKKALAAKDGRGKETSLKRRLLDYYEISQMKKIIPVIYGKDKPSLVESVAGFAPLVFEEASTGDRVARTIISKAGQELGRTAGAVIDRLEYKGRPVRIVLRGGVFDSTKKAPMMESFESELSSFVSSWTYARPKYSPAEGALIEAGKLARGELISPRWS